MKTAIISALLLAACGSSSGPSPADCLWAEQAIIKAYGRSPPAGFCKNPPARFAQACANIAGCQSALN